MKTCTVCKCDKPYEGFHKDASRKDGRRDRCKTCVALYMQAKYAADPASVKQRVYAWIDAHRAKHNAKCSRWVKANPGKVNARTARRYAAKMQATPAWLTADDNWLISETYAFAKLREKVVGGRWEVDHIVPLRGKRVMGLHVPWNLRVIPMTENRKKSNTVPL